MSATVLYFNCIEDDRIHVNCSRDVEIARWRIETERGPSGSRSRLQALKCFSMVRIRR